MAKLINGHKSTAFSYNEEGWPQFSVPTVPVREPVETVDGIVELAKALAPAGPAVRTSAFVPGTGSTDRSPSFSPDDTFYNLQWHFDFLGDIETVWDEFTGTGVNVGVYDDGTQYTHQDIVGNYDPTLHALIGGSPADPAPLSGDDAHGHSVAGLIAATANNEEGVVGVAHGASLGAVKIFGGPADINTAGSAFFEVIDQVENFDVVNHSWGGFNPFESADPFSIALIDEYTEGLAQGRGGLGTIQVQASGNETSDATGDYVHSARQTVSVAAYADDNDSSWYSNFGTAITVTAPTSGDSINARQVTTDLLGTDGYSAIDYTSTTNGFGGTSGATPVVAGVIALMLDANENLGWRDVMNILAYSSREVGSGVGGGRRGDEKFDAYYNGADNWNGGGLHFSEDYGYGSVDAFNAVRMAEVWDIVNGGEAQVTPNEASFTEDFNDIGLFIPDQGSGSHTFTVTNDVEIEYLNVTVRLDHTFAGDLSMTLTSPGGTTAVIKNDGHGSGSTAGTIWSWDFGINSFRGEDTAGDWTISLVDGFAADEGSLDSLSFTAYSRDYTESAASPDDTVYHYTDEVFTSLAREADRITIGDDAGVDFLNMAAMTADLLVNLNPNQQNKANGTHFLTIDSDTVIEGAIAGDGNDKFTGTGNNDQFYGMRGDDFIRSRGGDDVVDTGDGTNFADAGVGNDTIVGGDGNDELRGNLDIDVITGNAGDDTIFGGNAVDTITGDTGNDYIDVGNGDDTAWGNEGDDTLRGINGLDTLHGGDGNDEILGGIGFDTLYGDGGDDFIDGGNGNDSVFGGDGNDDIRGNLRNDILDGGLGNDVLRGGQGLDTFVFSDNDFGNDRISDFVDGEVIDLSFFGITFGDLTITDDGGPALVTFAEGSIKLTGVDFTTVTADDFIF